MFLKYHVMKQKRSNLPNRREILWGFLPGHERRSGEATGKLGLLVKIPVVESLIVDESILLLLG